MAYYIVKTPQENNPACKILSWVENRMALCQSDTTPDSSFVVEFPEQYYQNMYLYAFANGKRHKTPLLAPKVSMPGPDSTNRFVIVYTQTQLEERKQLLAWFAEYIFIPDMVRMGVTDADGAVLLNQMLDQLNTDTEIKDFMVNNLYYDL